MQLLSYLITEISSNVLLLSCHLMLHSRAYSTPWLKHCFSTGISDPVWSCLIFFWFLNHSGIGMSVQFSFYPHVIIKPFKSCIHFEKLAFASNVTEDRFLLGSHTLCLSNDLWLDTCGFPSQPMALVDILGWQEQIFCNFLTCLKSYLMQAFLNCPVWPSYILTTITIW